MLKLSIRHIFLFVICAIGIAGALFFQVAERRSAKMSYGEADSASMLPTAAPEDQALLSVEDQRMCTRERLYLQRDLERLPDVLKRRHVNEQQNEFPRQCFEFMLRYWGNAGIDKPANYFASCKTASSKPERGNYKPCVTEEYVNAIYNSYSDILSCLGIPERERLPKLLTESGGHLNTIGAGWDAGIAQLVGPTIGHANSQFEEVRRKFLASKGPACDRMRSIISTIQPLPMQITKGFFRKKTQEAGIENRCGLLTAVDNPVLSVFYLAVKHLQDVHALKVYAESSKFKIMERFQRAGLMEREIDKEKFRQLFMTLAYNTGANGAMILLKNYLDMKISHGRVVSLADFNFSKPGTAMDDDMQKTIVPTLGNKEDLAKAREELKRRYNDADLTFQQYLLLYQDVGGAGYLTWVARRAVRFNQVFSEGTCVPESYLSLE